MKVPPGRTRSSSSVPAQSSPSLYTVKRGDTLGAIARAHGITVAHLVAANPQLRTLANDPGKIQPGWELNIPPLQSRPVSTAPVPLAPARPPPAPSRGRLQIPSVPST